MNASEPVKKLCEGLHFVKIPSSWRRVNNHSGYLFTGYGASAVEQA